MTAVKLQFPDFLLSERRKTGRSTLPLLRSAGKLQLPVFLLPERRKTGKSILPPIRAAVKLRLQSSADESSGKGASCRFFHLKVEGNRKMRVYRPCKQR
ncbi:hypothetical protein AAC387_Pa11g1686 [Persea americana]